MKRAPIKLDPAVARLAREHFKSTGCTAPIMSYPLVDYVAPGELPLDHLLDAAVKVVSPGSEEPALIRRTLAKIALSALCEAIIAEGDLPLPLAVSLHPKVRKAPAADLAVSDRVRLGELFTCPKMGVTPPIKHGRLYCVGEVAHDLLGEKLIRLVGVKCTGKDGSDAFFRAAHFVKVEVPTGQKGGSL
jgi:hypothetical protein